MSRAPFSITAYRSIGTVAALRVRGRVLRNLLPSAAAVEHTAWQNLRDAMRRIYSDEAPGVTVEATYGGEQVQAVTDSEGYFDCVLTLREPITSTDVWHAVQVAALRPGTDERVAHTTADVLVSPASARYGVISDIDDTILQTQATNFVRTSLAILLQNAATRLPFTGVAALYQALQGGPEGSGYNPVFYVSSSPWNLYDFLVEFMQLRGIPSGPIFLKDYSVNILTRGFSHEHKLVSMREVLETYPQLPFVLMGDSGQQDPELYSRLVAEYPGRILAIYIRDMSGDRRDHVVDEMAAALGTKGVPMLRVADSLAATVSAVELGLLPAAAVETVRAAMEGE